MADQDMVTISKAEYDRLRAIESAAVAMINTTPIRHTSREWHQAWLAELNDLAKLLPVTRRFDVHPLV